jgi:hypothetical protein
MEDCTNSMKLEPLKLPLLGARLASRARDADKMGATRLPPSRSRQDPENPGDPLTSRTSSTASGTLPTREVESTFKGRDRFEKDFRRSE